MTVQELKDLKQQIETAKTELAKNEGARDQILKRWKDEFNCDSVEAVEKLVTDTEAQIKSLNIKLNTYTTEIEEAMA